MNTSKWKARAAGAVAAALGASAALGLAAQPATARPALHGGGIVASEAWSRPAARGIATAAVYLTLANHGGPDRLVGASTPVAESAELHRSEIRNGVASMAAVPGGLALPPGGTATLESRGYHLMLTGLKRPLAAGSAFPLTLRFDHAPALTVEVKVRGDAPAASMAGMKM